MRVNAVELQPGDVVVEFDDDFEADRYEMETTPRPIREDTLIAWVKGDKFPVYFDADERVTILDRS